MCLRLNKQKTLIINLTVWLYMKTCRAATHFQTMAFSLALYLAFPFIQITCTPLVLRGVGMRT